MLRQVKDPGHPRIIRYVTSSNGTKKKTYILHQLLGEYYLNQAEILTKYYCFGAKGNVSFLLQSEQPTPLVVILGQKFLTVMSQSIFHAITLFISHIESRGVGRGGQPPPSHQKKKEKRREGRGKEREKKKKEKRGTKRERKLNQSFQEHAVMGL